jgi:hypothetical protein
MFERSVQGACNAAAMGRIDNWVDEFLSSGLGANPPMALGLRKQRRWWFGPIRLPIDSLVRLCGPEPEMQYRQSVESWEGQIVAIMAVEPERLPPLILEYRGRLAPLGMHDGSHRHEALRRLGASHVWSLIWCNSEADFNEARPAYATIAALAR